ncbi:MAG: cytidylate kinase-like family protein [Geobacter sp.]|nr:cytidylate kinase-like family protein [Geobacter sp.]
MPETILFPSIEQRIAAFIEVQRRKDMEADAKVKKPKPTITLSREFGCEVYPLADRLKVIMEEKTRERWLLMDKALLEEVAKRDDLSKRMLGALGERAHWLDEFISTFTPRWKSERDYYQLLCKQIVSLAADGNVIIVGRGSAIITQEMKNCNHFRVYASERFKVQSIARRMKVTPEEAASIVDKQQRQRDKFIRDFLDCDAHDMSFYHLAFNNDKNSTDRMAHIISDYVLAK